MFLQSLVYSTESRMTIGWKVRTEEKDIVTNNENYFYSVLTVSHVTATS